MSCIASVIPYVIHHRKPNNGGQIPWTRFIKNCGQAIKTCAVQHSHQFELTDEAFGPKSTNITASDIPDQGIHPN